MIHLSSEVIVQVWERQKNFFYWRSWEAGTRLLALSPRSPGLSRPSRAHHLSICCLRTCRQKTMEGPTMKMRLLPCYSNAACWPARMVKMPSPGGWWEVQDLRSHPKCWIRICILVRSPIDSYVLWNHLAQTSLPITIKFHQSVSPSSIKYNNAT